MSEELADVVGLVGEEVPGVFVALAFATDHARGPVDDPTSVGVDKTADEFPGVGVDDLLLPGFESDPAVVLLAGAVLGKRHGQCLLKLVTYWQPTLATRHTLLCGRAMLMASAQASMSPGHASAHAMPNEYTPRFAALMQPSPR
ncbi:hypothetical protein KMB27_19310 [Streptomyces sp. COG19]|nr:hypothetical protein [Streptomyces sp. COG19]